VVEAEEDEPGAVVVDLSGAHRLVDVEASTAWYGAGPGAWSYGLPELYPPSGPLIANPGCYATAALLALGPLADVVDPAGQAVQNANLVLGLDETVGLRLTGVPV